MFIQNERLIDFRVSFSLWVSAKLSIATRKSMHKFPGLLLEHSMAVDQRNGGSTTNGRDLNFEALLEGGTRERKASAESTAVSRDPAGISNSVSTNKLSMSNKTGLAFGPEKPSKATRIGVGNQVEFPISETL